MDFKNLFKLQPEVVKLINSSFTNDRLVQTYLFHGEKGTLKMEAALYFASLVLCENGGNCGVCDQCKRLERLQNPNVYVISPDGETIKKEQIDNLEHEFSLTSDSKRVFIIRDIDKATLASANSLLKFLENLNENSYGILLTENINLVIPTIRSRSISVHFKPRPQSVISDALIKKGIEDDTARAIATLTNNTSEAVELANNNIILELIELVKTFGTLIEDESENPSLIFVEKGQILKQIDKKFQEYFMDLLIHIQNDKIMKLLCNDNNLVFSDTLEYTTLTLSMKQEVKILEKILEYKEKLKYNINIDLMYTALMIEIGKVK